jgi:hypothetical protein
VHNASSFVCHVLYQCFNGYGCKLRILIFYRRLYVQKNILLTTEKDEEESGVDPTVVGKVVGEARLGPGGDR